MCVQPPMRPIRHFRMCCTMTCELLAVSCVVCLSRSVHRGWQVMKNEHFIKINGLSNKYWGWGREDDDLRMRITTAEIEIEYPENYTEIATGRADTLLHMHDKGAWAVTK